MGMFTEENNAGSKSNGNGRDFEKAKGFANFYLPTPGGGRIKMGSIPLRASVKGEKAVLDFLGQATNEDELNVLMERLMAKLQFEFTPVTDKEVTLDI